MQCLRCLTRDIGDSGGTAGLPYSGRRTPSCVVHIPILVVVRLRNSVLHIVDAYLLFYISCITRLMNDTLLHRFTILFRKACSFCFLVDYLGFYTAIGQANDIDSEVDPV